MSTQPPVKPRARRSESGAVSVRWTLIGSVGTQVLNFGFFTILARQLGPTTFGLVALATIWVKFLTYFINQGLGLAIIQREKLESDHLNSVFWLSNLIGLVMMLSTWAMAGLVARFYSEPELQIVLVWLSISFLLTSLSSVQTAVMTRDQEFKQLAKRGLVGNLFGSVTAVILAFAGAGVWSLVAKQLVTSFVGSVVLWMGSTWRPQFRFSLAHLKELWGFSFVVLGRNLVGFFYLEGDKVVVGRVIDATQLGVYTIAKQLSRMVIDVLRKPLENVALPKLSKLQSDKAAVAAAICRGQALMNGVLMPIFAFTGMLSVEMVAIIFGEKWSMAAGPLRYLCWAEGIHSLAAISFTALMAVNKPKLSLFHLATTAAISLLATYIGSHWGVMGVAIGIFVTAFLSVALNIALLCSATQVRFLQYLRTGAGPTLGSVAMAGTAFLTNEALGAHTWVYLRVACAGVASVAVYVLVLKLVSQELYTDGSKIFLATLGVKKPATS